MSDNRDWQADKINNLLKRCEIAKSYGETIAVSPDAIIDLIQQYAAEKQRADIAELAYHGLKEACVTIGEYQSLLDKHTAMTKAYRAEKERADQAKDLLIDAVGCVVMFSGGGNHHVKRLLGEMRALYPDKKEMLE